MLYINTKTRMKLESNSPINGGDWVPFEPGKKKEPEPVKVETTEKAEAPEEVKEEAKEVKEAPKAEKKPAKANAKNTVKPRKRS